MDIASYNEKKTTTNEWMKFWIKQTCKYFAHWYKHVHMHVHWRWIIQLYVIYICIMEVHVQNCIFVGFCFPYIQPKMSSLWFIHEISNTLKSLK